MRKINRPPCPNPTALATDYKYPQNKEALKNASFGKCMYCESIISHIDYGDIEHIKPKSRFPGLKFEWNNLGYSCTRCNREYKKDKFNEDTPYINPYNEDPNEHIFISGAFVMQKQGSERGELTKIDIGLNRDSLIQNRQEKIDRVQKTVDACYRTSNEALKNDALEALKKEANEDKEYSLCIKYLLKSQDII
ncbi:MAG: HNH endonuclease [Candidatus Gracilibacteria bacterium]|nr:HNH endonuclease [Candidatus Gracilibacteria bacterium]